MARLALVDQHGQGENSCQSHPSAKISCTYFAKVNGKSVVATINMFIGRPAPVQNAQSPSFGNRARKAEAGVASAGPTTPRNHLSPFHTVCLASCTLNKLRHSCPMASRCVRVDRPPAADLHEQFVSVVVDNKVRKCLPDFSSMRCPSTS